MQELTFAQKIACMTLGRHIKDGLKAADAIIEGTVKHVAKLSPAEKYLENARRMLALAIKEIEEEKHRTGAGATNEYPDGKLDETDEGALNILISEHQDNIRMDFGKPVAFLAMPAVYAKAIGIKLLNFADKSDAPAGD